MRSTQLTGGSLRWALERIRRPPSETEGDRHLVRSAPPQLSPSEVPVQIFQDLIDANERYRQGFDAGDLLPLPQRQLAVLTCMDCRIDTASVFGLDPGDAHVLRNAGARASDDAIRSLIISTTKLGVRRIAVVHHTHCGAASTTHEELVDEVRQSTGADSSEIDYLLFTDPAEALRSDVERLATCPYLPEGVLVAGFMYDVSTGVIEQATDIRAVGATSPV